MAFGDYGNIHSVIIIHNDGLALEEYFMEWNRHMLHMCASVTKSFTSSLIGIAIEEGYISGLEEEILNFFPEYDDIENLDERKESITFENVLTMTGGFTWDEIGIPYTDSEGNPNPENDLMKMFKELISKGFIEDIGDLNDNLSLHFSLEKRNKISLNPEIPFQKINWIKPLNDLVFWYRSLYEKNLIDEPNNKHVLAVYHFKLSGKNLDKKIFTDRYGKVRKGDTDYNISQSIENLIESLPSNK